MNQKSIAYTLIVYSIISFILVVNENGVALVLGSIGVLAFGLYLLYKVEPQFKGLLHSEKVVGLKGTLVSGGGGKLLSNLPVVPLISALLMLISTFLPWMATEASVGGHAEKSPALGLSDYDDSLVPTFLILLAMAAAFMAFKRVKFAFTAGLVSLMIGVAYIAGWLGRGANAVGSYGGYGVNVEVSLVPQAGFYLLIIASLAYSISTFKFFRKAD